MAYFLSPDSCFLIPAARHLRPRFPMAVAGCTIGDTFATLYVTYMLKGEQRSLHLSSRYSLELKGAAVEKLLEALREWIGNAFRGPQPVPVRVRANNSRR